MKGAADIFATIIIWLLALGVAAFLLMWTADKVMKALDWMTRFE